LDSFGEIIRKKRRGENITLKEMAERTGLSVSFLSEIERNVAKPSMGSLRKITQVLQISLLSFSEDASEILPKRPTEAASKSSYVQDVRIVRANQRKKLGYPDRPGFYELLTPDLNRALQVLYVKIDPNFETGAEPIQDPVGEKFILVLRGTYETTINKVVYTLTTGDSIYYPAESEVFFRTLSNEPVELILVVTPPGF
jgi:transcriptional regulator with XRE-family HTH domain